MCVDAYWWTHTTINLLSDDCFGFWAAPGDMLLKGPFLGTPPNSWPASSAWGPPDALSISRFKKQAPKPNGKRMLSYRTYLRNKQYNTILYNKYRYKFIIIVLSIYLQYEQYNTNTFIIIVFLSYRTYSYIDIYLYSYTIQYYTIQYNK